MNAEPKKPEPQKPTQVEVVAGPEIVENIAVKDQVGSQQPGTPPSTVAKDSAPPAPDKELDGILKQVNQNVKTDKKSYLEKAQQTAGSIQATKKQGIFGGKLRAVMPIALALVVVVGLSATAVYAFSQSQPSTINTNDSAGHPEASEPNQSSEEPAVTPENVSSFAESIDSELNALDDSQDFGQESLSDATLEL